MKKDKEQLRFEIDQLRSASLVCTLESVALTILAMVLFIGAPSVFPEIINPYDPNSLKILQGIIIVPTAYFVFALFGNIVRIVKVQKLQKSLYTSKK